MTQIVEPPRVAGRRYRLLECLGEGGMGAVYRAIDRLSGDAVALKSLNIPPENLIFNTRPSTLFEKSPLALAQEFQTLASLRHPNIITVLDYGFDEHQLPYFTMTLLENAHSIYEAASDTSEKINLLLQLLQALAYLHRRGVIHRDLKPANVLVIHDREGRPQVKVLDFGLAVQEVRPEEVAGTPAYIAPEVLLGYGASFASDLYSVGVIAYRMFTGRFPFDTVDYRELSERTLYQSPDLSPLPPDLQLPIGTLLDKHPRNRYASADEAIAALALVVDQPFERESLAIRESFLQAAKFVGRTAELETLSRALDDAWQGRGSAWLIGGESGVGKSRLIDELRTRALVMGAIVLRGQLVSEGGLPYEGWRAPLRELSLLVELTDREAAVLKPIIPDIETLIERDVQDAPFDRQRFQQVVVDLFRSERRQPILLVLEDLHWADESLDPLRLLTASARDLPLLIVGSYRDDERPDLPDLLPEMKLMRLQRFDRSGIEQLGVSMLGDSGRRSELLSLLEQETEGNVFFLIETIRALAEAVGRLDDVGQATLPPLVASGSIQAVLRRRLNRVPSTMRDLLKLAAVAGRQLDLALLSALGGRLDDFLTVCANIAVLDVQGGVWRFSHDKLREAVLEDLTFEETALFNRQVAEGIERVYAEQLDERAGVLLGHWQRAGDVEREKMYILQAAALAYRAGDNLQAKALYERALALDIPCTAPDPTRAHADLLFRLGRTHYGMGEYSDTIACGEQALELYRQLDDPHDVAEALNLIGEAHMRMGELDHAEGLFKEGLELRQRTTNKVALGYSYLNLGVLENNRGHMRSALELFEQSYDLMREGGSSRDIARALNNRANTHDMLGDHERAVALHQEALALRRADEDRVGISYSLLNLAVAYLEMGDLKASRSHAEEALHLARLNADRLVVSTILRHLSVVALKEEQYWEAQLRAEESLVLVRQTRSKLGEINSLTMLGKIARHLTDYDMARRWYHDALMLLSQHDYRSTLYTTLQDVALLFSAMGDHRSAYRMMAYLKRQPEDQFGEHGFQQPDYDAAYRAVSAYDRLGLDAEVDRLNDASLTTSTLALLC